MTMLKWDESGKKMYETGTRQGALYPIDSSGAYSTGVAWNGLQSVTEKPSGAEATALYADDGKYLNMMSAEEFGATIEAYTYPEEFAACDGSVEIAKGVTIGQQSRKVFGMVYKTILGNDVDGDSHGYKLHIIYGAQASPSEKAYKTVNESPEAVTMSWELKSTPVPVTGKKPTASIVINSTKADSTKLAALEKILFGDDTDSKTPRLPLPDEIATLMATGA